MSDTNQIILAVVGTGITLLGILVGLLVSLFRILRQDIKETNARIDSAAGALNSRIDSAAGTLNSRIDSAAITLNSRIDSLRQEMRTDIAALHARIDALYQALFNHKDPAA